jgi:hypothetical protein
MLTALSPRNRGSHLDKCR